MVNLIKSGVYRITKTKAFIGVIIFCLFDILLAIFMNKALYPNELIDGASSLEASFMSNDTLPIIFMFFLATLVSEDYSSGVMKNIIGKGIGKIKYYMSNVIIISIVSVLIMVLYSVVLTSYYTLINGFGSVENWGDIFLKSIGYIAVLLSTMSIIATSVVITKKSTSALMLGAAVLYIPSVLNLVANLIKLKIDFKLIDLNYYRSFMTSPDFEPKMIIQVIAIASIYSILAIMVGNIILKKQDIK